MVVILINGLKSDFRFSQLKGAAMVSVRSLTSSTDDLVFATNHLSEINNLLRQLVSNPSALREVTPGELIDLLNAYPQSIIIVAIDDDASQRIVGLCMIAFQNRLEGPMATIDSVVVDEEYRRQGIGAELVNAMLAEAKKFVVQRGRKLPIYLSSNPNNPRRAAAIHLYLTTGFALISQAANETGTNWYKITIQPK